MAMKERVQGRCRGPVRVHARGDIQSIATGLGINWATLREWVLRDRERCGVTAAAAQPAVQPKAAVPSEDPDGRIRQLEARAAELEASERKLATERDTLRKGGSTTCTLDLP